MKFLPFYYNLKPLIPRLIQIWLRRMIIHFKRKSVENTWPIHIESKDGCPRNWQGWPQKKQFSLILTHDVETARGQSRCYEVMRLEKEMGFRSSFNFVPLRYQDDPSLRRLLVQNGFEVGIHDLKHDGSLFQSKLNFNRQALTINNFIKQWEVEGFRAGSMFHNLEWITNLDILYDASTFDIDPFEPQSDGMGTIFPFWINGPNGRGYVELPYTIPQDHTLFILMKEKSIALWLKKLEWIIENNGMVLLITHPDYMSFKGGSKRCDEYPVQLYKELLSYIKINYENEYWNPLPCDLARFWQNSYVEKDVNEVACAA